MLETLKTIPKTSNERRNTLLLIKLLSKEFDNSAVPCIGYKLSDINKEPGIVRVLLSPLDMNPRCLSSA